MFTDADQGVEDPFTGNDRFVVYEDGGRPFDIHLARGWQPSCAIVKRVAEQLLEALAYLRMKKVVHRKLQLATVVLNPETTDVKLISLGGAKYIEHLDYEKQVLDFEIEWQGLSPKIGVKRGASSRGVSPPAAPQPTLSNVSKDSSITFQHPEITCVTSASFNTCQLCCVHF
jgi:serine/threonine protein kinase